MTATYPPRAEAFREEMIRLLPRAPNNRASLEAVQAMPTRSLIQAFVTWRMRLIPAKLRAVRFCPGGITPWQAQAWKGRLRPFLLKVAAGTNLAPHLSGHVMKKGIILPGASPADRGKDIDMVLTREGLHHFHIGAATPANPKGRSGSLLFAEVLEREFIIVAIAGHGVFEDGSTERLQFFEGCHAYMAKDFPPGQAFMANPVISSGHSMLVTLFADRCEDEIGRIDPLLDDVAFIDELYQGASVLRDGKPVIRPKKPALKWHFEDLQFGIFDSSTMVFFCIFPFFAR